MATRSLSARPLQLPKTGTRLRGRVSAAFGKLVESSPELNAVSDELAKPIHAIDAALQKLNLGVSAWVHFAEQRCDDGEILSSRSIGYAKVSGTWGIAIRWDGTDTNGNPTSEEWRFNDAPRSYRLHASHKLPELLEELAETASKTAEQLKSRVAETQQIAATISPLAAADRLSKR